jgi:trimeric autotransporter adhesin
MKSRPILILGLTLAVVAGAQAAISFNGSYSENFDSMGAAGTEYPSGWIGVNYRTSPATPLALGITTGTTTSGGLYNVGAAGDADRALGSLATGSVAPQFGVSFLNESGDVITGLQFSGVMEQWRRGADATVNESLQFEYSLDAIDIADPNATWQPFAAMNLTERLTESTSAGAVNGNDPENQIALTGLISDLGWLQNSSLTIRWTDIDHAGSDGLYALDNFTMSAVPEPSTVALLGLGLLGILARRRAG